MINIDRIDIEENSIKRLDAELLAILLQDKNSGRNIIWATNDYEQKGYGFYKNDEICINSITGINGDLIKPRTKKTGTTTSY